MNMEIFQGLSQKEQKSYIDKLDWAYYNEDNSLVSDTEYDEYRRIYENKYGDLNYVSGVPSKDFESFKHPIPVTSLAKIKAGELDELHRWREMLDTIAIEPKFDGLTVVAYPKDGKWRFVTRGSGVEGEILPNFISQYEQEDGWGDCRYAIRGEAFLTQKAFSEIVADQTERGEKPFKQIRNAAAGILRSKERSRYIDKLSYICYDVLGFDVSESQKSRFIETNTPFDSVDIFATIVLDKSDEYVEAQIEKCFKFYQDAGVPVDGVVIKSEMNDSLQKLGFTGHHPRNAAAWKPGRTEVVTVVRDVIWQMGRGKATPVAVLDPVELDGTTVTRASLHNASMIKELGLKIGAKVTVYKANQIIPQIGEVLEPGDKDIVLDVCPACGGPLEDVNGQQFCNNPACDERIAQDIAFVGGKDVLNIDGLSIETARKMVAYWKKIHPDERPVYTLMFTFNQEMLMALEGFAEKSAEKLYGSIQAASRNVDLPRFIKALCLPGIGTDVGKILADEFGSLEKLLQKLAEEPSPQEMLQEINGIGPKTAEVVSSAEFSLAVKNLQQYVSIATYEKQEVPAGDFAGKIFVLTGKMAQPRSYYVELIEKAGGKEGKSVSGKTDYLVIQDVNSTSSKAVKAREMGTKLISPEELVELLS